MADCWTTFWVASGVLFGQYSGIVVGLSKEVKTVEKLQWSWQEGRSGLIWGLFFGLVSGLIGALLGGLINEPPNTPITLTLQHTATAICITIHNESEPISPESQSILFQQFRRTRTAEEQKGWGLGLFLAKNLIEAHQGTIEVESAEGKGTSFIITLPVVPPEPTQHPSNQIEDR